MPVRIFSHYVHLPVLLLGIVEALIFYAALYAGSYIRFATDPSSIAIAIGDLQPRAVLYSLLMMSSMVATGLYHARQRPRLIGVILRIAIAVIGGTIAATMVFYIFPGLFVGRGALALSGVVALAGVALIRAVFINVVDDEIFKRRVLVFGAGRRAASITTLRRRADQRGFYLVGFVPAASDNAQVDPDMTLQLEGPLLEFAREFDIDEIVVAMDDRRRSFPVRELLECRLCGIDVIDLLNFLERETGKVRLDVMNPSWLIFSEGFRRDTFRLFSKRVFDLVASGVLLTLTLPVMVLAALAILVEDGWGKPILYRQRRVGLDGHVFNVLKFRSMTVDAEKEGKAQWASVNDSRITRVGSFIRKVRIDELPQVLNVLRGNMSFVGPRPERPEFVEKLNEEIPYYRERHCVKPGITGWAQLCYPYGSSERDALEKLQYDLFYVKNHNLIFDLLILLQTTEVILWGQGAR